MSARGPAARPRGRVLVRHRRLRRQRAARRPPPPATPHPARTAGRRTASTPPASTRTPRRPARTAPSAPRTCSGSASCRWTRSPAAPGSTRWRCGAQNLCTPGEELRAGGKPLDADLVGRRREGRRGARLGRPSAAGHGPRAVGRPARRRRAPGLERRSCAWRRTANAVVLVGTTEVGQGARTVFAQIAAEELRLPAERVTVRGADTRFTPYDRSTGASRSTTLAGLAVKRAAEEVRAQLVEIAGSEDVESDSYPELFVRHFGLAGGELIGRGEVAPRGLGLLRGGPGLLGGLRRRRRGRGRRGHRARARR